jgi:hypothetical protein
MNQNPPVTPFGVCLLLVVFNLGAMLLILIPYANRVKKLQELKSDKEGCKTYALASENLGWSTAYLGIPVWVVTVVMSCVIILGHKIFFLPK